MNRDIMPPTLLQQEETLPSLPELEASELKMAAAHWINYYYRPLVFQDEYFEHAKPSLKYRAIKGQLHNFFADFVEIFSNSCLNITTLNTYRAFLDAPGKETASIFFNQLFYFFDYSLSQNSELVILQMKAKIPFAGRVVADYALLSKNDLKVKSEKVRNFLYYLFLDTYPDWLEDLRGEG